MMRSLPCAIAAMAIAASASAAQNAGDASHTAGRSNAFGNSNAPINVSSDNFIGNFETKVGTYNGNVIVTQANNKLHADTVKVDVVAGKPSRLEARGHVVFVSASGTATGDNGVYDLGPRTITLTGHVILTKNKDVMRGTSLVVDMKTGESHLTAHGAQGNRVQGLFVQQPQSSTGAGKPDGNVRQ
jgi:lipopolysaccharide export system protein LptA